MHKSKQIKYALGLAVILCLIGLIGCQGRQPGALETAAMSRLKQSITVRGKNVSNPWPNDQPTIEAGRKSFSHYCMVCHGLDGQNTGVPFAEKMSPPAPLLNSWNVQAYTDGQLKWIIENGLFPSGMPASKGILNDDEMWQIVRYLRHLPAKGSLGEPAVFSQ